MTGVCYNSMFWICTLNLTDLTWFRPVGPSVLFYPYDTFKELLGVVFVIYLIYSDYLIGRGHTLNIEGIYINTTPALRP